MAVSLMTVYAEDMFKMDMDDSQFKIIVPEFQRDLVWEPEQKVRWIESMISGYPLPSLFMNTFWEKPLDYDGCPDEHHVIVIDGQQRLNAVKEFIQDKFPVQGCYYSEQALPFKRRFRYGICCTIYWTQFKTMRESIELYLGLLRNGKPHSGDDIQRAQDQLKLFKEVKV